MRLIRTGLTARVVAVAVALGVSGVVALGAWYLGRAHESDVPPEVQAEQVCARYRGDLYNRFVAITDSGDTDAGKQQAAFDALVSSTDALATELDRIFPEPDDPTAAYLRELRLGLERARSQGPDGLGVESDPFASATAAAKAAGLEACA